MKCKRTLTIAAMSAALMLSSCGGTPKIIGYSIDSSNNVIVVYDNSSSENVGNLAGEKVAELITSVSVSQDGYFVLNGIKTDIKVEFKSVSISEDGFYVIDGIKTGIKAAVGSISISPDGFYVVDGVKTSIKVNYESISISPDGYYVIDGIKTDIRATNVYTVTFEPGNGETVPEQRIFEGKKVERPQIERRGYDLDGWFCNGEEWRFNSDVVLNDMTLEAEWTARKYNVSFENPKGADPEPIVVTFDGQATLPTVEPVTGYSFAGWFDGSSKVSDGTWKIDRDVILTAKWTANEYTITLDPGVGSVSKTTAKATYDQDYKLPVPTNSYGVFAGWLCDGEPVTDSDGNSLAPWTFTENKTFTVDWVVKITDRDGLERMSQMLNAEYELLNDINLGSEEWTPIGTSNAPFTGKLHGNGHSIQNMTITSFSGCLGLFGVFEGTVEDVIFESASVSCALPSQELGAGVLCGYAHNANISGIKTSGTVSIGNHSSDFADYAAGICGFADLGTVISECDNGASVSSYYYAAGVTAYARQPNVSECVNRGDIVSYQNGAGGIIGAVVEDDYREEHTFSRLANYGNVNGAGYCGGVLGYQKEQKLSTYEFEECANFGSVYSSADGLYMAAGGIAGNVYGGSFTKCFNRGEIRGRSAGGIAGFMNMDTEFKTCYSSGNVRATTSYAGGIGGWINSGAVKECVTFGTISSAGSLSSNACGTDVVTTITISNVYYNCTASNYSGTATSERYAAIFYTGSLFWSESDWTFSETDYPMLNWLAE